jgi:hypothetical protein
MMMFWKLVCAVAVGVLLAACGGGDDGGGGKVCTVGKACGDTCIAANLTCHQ